MKIAFVYDTLIAKGGAERVALELAEELGADIITSGFSEEIRKWFPTTCRIIDLGNWSIQYAKPIGILLEAPLRFFLNRNKFQYDVYIFSGITSLYGSNKHNRNIWFCPTPNRMLYDLYEHKISSPNILHRLFFRFYRLLFLQLDQYIVHHNFVKIIAQDYTIKERILKYYNISSDVIYAPVHTSHFHCRTIGDYYLTVARLFPEKRIDIIAQAFTQMPDQKLIIIGDGPERNRLRKIIHNHQNITSLTHTTEKQLIEYYANCRATIYMPVNEDFGLVPIEGMASGKMCIGVNEGGVRETVQDGITGYLIHPTIGEIIKTVQSFDVTKANSMKEDCLKNARRFDIKTIGGQWKKLLEDSI